jgi:hypothetical protein
MVSYYEEGDIPGMHNLTTQRQGEKMPPISMETGLKRKQILILGFKSPDL